MVTPSNEQDVRFIAGAVERQKGLAARNFYIVRAISVEYDVKETDWNESYLEPRAAWNPGHASGRDLLVFRNC